MRRHGPALVAVALTAGLAACSVSAQGPVPCGKTSLKFGVIGDFGDGSKGEYAAAAKFADLYRACAFDMVITVGDNLYGSERPQDFATKFETPFKPLLDKGVKFYASLGNHDDPNQRFYKPFNMNEQRYYTLTRGNVEFFAIDSNYVDAKQIKWLDDELKASKAEWKFPYFHHPLYSSAGGHGSSLDIRATLEPIFLRYGVQVVFNGHDHVYERTKPQKGIYYFVAGSTGKLRAGDITKTAMTAASYDKGRAVMMVEVADDAMFFQTVSEEGKQVDAGCIPRAADLKPGGSRTRCPAPGAASSAGGSR